MIAVLAVTAWVVYGSSRRAPADAVPPLPKLGPAQAVEYDDVGDPFVLTVPSSHGRPGEYVLFWTTDWQSNVPTAVSADLHHWTRVADALPALPTWAQPSISMTWAPAAQAVPGGWVLYFSTEDAGSKRECIGAAYSTAPTGPYTDDSAAPLVCQPALGGSIDPSVVKGPGGRTRYLVWKNDGNATGLPSAIWEQQLSPDGQHLVGTASRLIGATQPWEDGIVEGPAMLASSHGGYWLFVSAGRWQSVFYGTGLYWCANVAGPCRASSAGPYLTSTPGAVSPGGFDTFRALDGHLWASWSAFPGRPANARAAMAENRVLEIAPVTSD
jgi:beta-xylosidase